MIRSLSLTLTALLSIGCAAEMEQDREVREPALELTGRVVDAANILSPGFEQGLTARLAQLEEETLVQLVVATTPDLGGGAIADYSLDLSNTWGLGDAERNDGLLLLVAPNERQVRIEVGFGLEASVRDEEAAIIIRNDILPHFRKGDFERGISSGVEGLVQEVTPSAVKKAA